MFRPIHFVGAVLVVLVAACGAEDPEPGPKARAVKAEETVSFPAGDVTLRGVLFAGGADSEKRSAVLVIPEWWGLNDYAKRRAKMLADLGYVALAADVYGDGKTAAEPAEAGRLAGEFWKDPAVARARVAAAVEFLRNRPEVDPARVAAIGYCFGGTVVLQAARWGLPLAGVVSFHGNLAPKGEPAKEGMRARILVCHGGRDSFVSAGEVAAFLREMAEAKARLTFNEYAEAKHAFTNQDADRVAREFNLDVAYDAVADGSSFADMKAFLAETLN